MLKRIKKKKGCGWTGWSRERGDQTNDNQDLGVFELSDTLLAIKVDGKSVFAVREG